MFCLFFPLSPLQFLEKSDLEVLDFGIFLSLAILDWYPLGISNVEEFLYVHNFIEMFFVLIFGFSLSMYCSHQWVITVTQIPDEISNPVNDAVRLLCPFALLFFLCEFLCT